MSREPSNPSRPAIVPESDRGFDPSGGTNRRGPESARRRCAVARIQYRSIGAAVRRWPADSSWNSTLIALSATRPRWIGDGAEVEVERLAGRFVVPSACRTIVRCGRSSSKRSISTAPGSARRLRPIRRASARKKGRAPGADRRTFRSSADAASRLYWRESASMRIPESREARARAQSRTRARTNSKCAAAARIASTATTADAASSV